ncbi:MAG: hypothetical protein LBT37_08115 [Lactobacillaceae bacterium]|jgi:amino acid permease|nr:hypothetical protein [Lactobacillaceae bacterium]
MTKKEIKDIGICIAALATTIYALINNYSAIAILSVVLGTTYSQRVASKKIGIILSVLYVLGAVSILAFDLFAKGYVISFGNVILFTIAVIIAGINLLMFGIKRKN